MHHALSEVLTIVALVVLVLGPRIAESYFDIKELKN